MWFPRILLGLELGHWLFPRAPKIAKKSNFKRIFAPKFATSVKMALWNFLIFVPKI
jgi:hypothetical protein